MYSDKHFNWDHQIRYTAEHAASNTPVVNSTDHGSKRFNRTKAVGVKLHLKMSIDAWEYRGTVFACQGILLSQIHHQLSVNLGRAGVSCKFSFTSVHENNLHLCRKFDQHRMLVVDQGSRAVGRPFPRPSPARGEGAESKKGGSGRVLNVHDRADGAQKRRVSAYATFLLIYDSNPCGVRTL